MPRARISAYLVTPIRQGELLEAICNQEPRNRTELVTRHTLRESKHQLRVLLAGDNAVNQTLAVRLLDWLRGVSFETSAGGVSVATISDLVDGEIVFLSPVL